MQIVFKESDGIKMFSKHKILLLISPFICNPAIEATAPISTTSFSFFEGTFGRFAKKGHFEMTVAPSVKQKTQIFFGL